MSKRKIISIEDLALSGPNNIGELENAVQERKRDMLEMEVQQQINALDYVRRQFQHFQNTILLGTKATTALEILQPHIPTEFTRIIDFLYSQFPGTSQVKLNRLAMIALLKGEGLPARPILPRYAENPLYTNSFFPHLILRQYNKSLFEVNLLALIIFSDIFSISTLAMCEYWTRPEIIEIIQSQSPSGILTVFLRSLVKSHETNLSPNIGILLKSVCEIWVGYEKLHTELSSQVQDQLSWNQFLHRMKQMHRFANYGENAKILERELYDYLRHTLADQVLTMNHIKIFIENILMPYFGNFPTNRCNAATEKFLFTKCAIFVKYMDYMQFGVQYATCITKHQGGGYFNSIFRVMIQQNPRSLCEYRTGFWNLPEENLQDSTSDDSSSGDDSNA
jgi:hypothetical protein